jgi:hypothetical protein
LRAEASAAALSKIEAASRTEPASFLRMAEGSAVAARETPAELVNSAALAVEVAGY